MLCYVGRLHEQDYLITARLVEGYRDTATSLIVLITVHRDILFCNFANSLVGTLLKSMWQCT